MAGFARSPANATDDFALARYNRDGSLDDGSTSDTTPGDRFGTAGRVRTDFSGANDEIFDLRLQPDGKIVVAGSTGASADFALARYNNDGSLDDGSPSDTTPADSFGSAGKVTTDFGGEPDDAFAVVLQADGKIVAAGSTGVGSVESPKDFALARYNRNGSLDDGSPGDLTPGNRFGPDGTVRTDFASIDPDDAAQDVALQPDGKIVAAGDSRIARYNGDGSLDDSFGADGKVATDSAGRVEDFGGRALALQPDGKMVVVGLASLDFQLSRYNRDGSLDDGAASDATPKDRFGISGRTRTDFAGQPDIALDLAIQLNGKIVAAGQAAFQGRFDFAIARYNSDGSLDDGGAKDASAADRFGVAGKVNTDFAAGNDGARAIALQPDGNIVAAGFASSSQAAGSFAVARYLGDPVPQCAGRFATMVGSGTIRGTEGDDVIIGSDRVDSIHGYGGSDVICAREQNDNLAGHAGDDELYGEQGHDNMNGGPDDDQLDGGPGSDRMQGFDGVDILRGGDLNDTLFGQRGNDILQGENGNDRLDGGPNTDTCTQGPGTGPRSNCEG